MTFQTWVEELIEKRFKTATALAAAVGMELSPFTRGVAAGKLNLVNLLKLAYVADESPSRVLRLAGKDREVEVIEAVYGPEKKVSDPVVQDLVNTWPALTAHEKNYVRSTVTMMLRARMVPTQDRDPNAPTSQPKPRRARRKKESSDEIARRKRGRSTSSGS